MDVTERLEQDQYYLEIVRGVGDLADCRRRRVGAIVVWDNRIVAQGSIKSRVKGLSCLAGDCPRGRLSYEALPAYTSYDNCISIHAEMVALRTFAQLLYHIRFDMGRDGWATRLRSPARMYVTDQPCGDCADQLDRVGLDTVYGSAELEGC